MITATTKFSMKMLLIALTFVAMVGCDKKCQKPAEESFKTITNQKWRMVETTDPNPAFKSLGKYSFLIWEFGLDMTGTVNVVRNNKEFKDAVLTFDYTVDKDSGIIRAAFAETTLNEGTEATEELEPVEYSYELGRELELYESGKGYYTRFVPYQGIVEPDNTCTF